MPRKRQEPPKAEGYSTSYMDPYGAMRVSNPNIKDPEEMKRQMAEQQLRARQMVLQQQAASAVAAASKTQREVYIGNLAGGVVTEDALRQLFNSTMAAAFPAQMVAGLDAVVNVSMHSEGRYAFVELRSPEMATAALQLSGQVQLLGQPISVGRPSGYVDPSAAQAAARAAAEALDRYKQGDITVLNQFMPGALTPGGTAVPGIAPAASVAASPAVAQAAMGAGLAPAATQFLQVEGMVTADVLADDEEYAEVIQDLHEECGKYGAITRVFVPRPPNPSFLAASVYGTGNYGKAFVAFSDAGGAAASKAAIHGRMFAGVSLQVNFVTQEYFTSVAGAV